MMDSTITLAQVLTVASVLCAIYFGAKNWTRTSDRDVSTKARFEAVMSEKLDSIGEDTKEIKREITDVKKAVSDLTERVVKVEQSVKTAHHRLDLYEDREYEDPHKRHKKRR